MRACQARFAEQRRKLRHEHDLAFRMHLQGHQQPLLAAAWTLQLLPQPEQTLLEVDVAPLQTQDLSLSHTRIEEHCEQRPLDDAARSCEQAADLVMAEHAAIVTVHLGPLAALQLRYRVRCGVAATNTETEEAACCLLDGTHGRGATARRPHLLTERDDVVRADLLDLGVLPGREDVARQRPAVVVAGACTALIRGDQAVEEGEEVTCKPRSCAGCRAVASPSLPALSVRLVAAPPPAWAGSSSVP